MKMFLIVTTVLLAGIIIGFVLSRHLMDTTKFGELIIDSTDPEKDLLSFNMTNSIGKIINKKYTVLKIIVRK